MARLELTVAAMVWMTAVVVMVQGEKWEECVDKCGVSECCKACTSNQMGPAGYDYYCVSTWPLNPKKWDLRQSKDQLRCSPEFWLGACPTGYKCEVTAKGTTPACFKPLGYATWIWIVLAAGILFLIGLPLVILITCCVRKRRSEKAGEEAGEEVGEGESKAMEEGQSKVVEEGESKAMGEGQSKVGEAESSSTSGSTGSGYSESKYTTVSNLNSAK